MKHDQEYFKVAPGIWGLKIVFVNVYMVTSNGHWVLVDAGLQGSANRIIRMARSMFGNTPPAAILLTHGHFDHRGALEALLEKWNVPVYAHPLELPYLTGRSSYPPPDPTVGGGLMSFASFLYPKRPIDVGQRVQPLPAGGTVPFLPEWEAIFVPGHSPGQVAFFRRSDRTLIAGDAFVTTKQESAVATLTGLPALSGPPKYFTYDWEAAYLSLIKLKDLEPLKAATGHGPPMYGEALQHGLETLINDFDRVAKPSHGRYVDEPAVADENGVKKLPPRVVPPAVLMIAGIVLFGLLLKIRK